MAVPSPEVPPACQKSPGRGMIERHRYVSAKLSIAHSAMEKSRELI
jgi:hypothetical protein